MGKGAVRTIAFVDRSGQDLSEEEEENKSLEDGQGAKTVQTVRRKRVST